MASLMERNSVSQSLIAGTQMKDNIFEFKKDISKVYRTYKE